VHVNFKHFTFSNFEIKNGVFLCIYETLKVLLKVQGIFVILLSIFVIRNFRGTCSSFEMIKGT